MDISEKHEVVEIEALDRLKSMKALEPLVFGGGTMLRLCHELKRYSADLDFWFIKNVSQNEYFKRVSSALIIEFPARFGKQSREFKKKLSQLRDTDFKVKLGAILENDIREYYILNRFNYLEEKLAAVLPNK